MHRTVAGGAGGGEAGCSGVAADEREARQQAKAVGLALLKAYNKAGYFGVYLNKPDQPKPYQAQVRRGGKTVSLGMFATAKEAALFIARSPEGQAAAKRAAPQLSEERARVRSRPCRPTRSSSRPRPWSRRRGALVAGSSSSGRSDHLLRFALTVSVRDSGVKLLISGKSAAAPRVAAS